MLIIFIITNFYFNILLVITILFIYENKIITICNLTKEFASLNKQRYIFI